MRKRRWTAVLGAALLAGCQPATICTLIGCEGGLAVELAARPTGAYRVEVAAPGDPTQYVYACHGGNTCMRTVVFHGLTAARVDVRVTTAAGTRTQQFTPDYRGVYPNGRRCGAACEQATVSMALPG